ncbi:DUF481 domain-containing protein [Dokdonia genika]|uniref:DUF481 domain-containing protein n=1 Tax=Dokdonia genika TaxID=308113 RepID=A0ABV9L931_9FLAO
MKFKPFSLLLSLLVFPNILFAQNDTIVASNGQVVIGSIKEMYKGVLKLKTDYSDSDFTIQWSKVKRISSIKEYIISSTDGEIYNGSLRSKNNQVVSIINSDTITTSLPLEQIVFLRTLKSNFLSKLSASLAFGYNFTKSNNLSQFNLRSTLGYKARKWTINGNFNGISATRDEVEDVQRLDAALSYRYFLRKDWYPLAEVNILANTEQNIALRTVTRLGIGKYIKRTNSMYWGVQAGTSYNNERFTEGDPTSQNSLEGFIASDLNLYDIGDLSLLTRVVAYPGITESGRLRMDAVLDLQYDLPLDFFVKLGFTINYDNQAMLTDTDYDYVFQTSFGWKI